MTIKVNAMGDACPIPVVKTQKAMQTNEFVYDVFSTTYICCVREILCN